MKLLGTLTAGALALSALAMPMEAQAQPGWGHHHGWHHRHCRVEWRHHHRVRRCW